MWSHIASQIPQVAYHALRLSMVILTLQQFRLPNNLPAFLPTIRPGSTMDRALVFSHNKGNCTGFTKLLFQRKFIHSAMLLPFILY